MKRVFKIVFPFVLLVLGVEAWGQTKHALLIGINDYYETKDKEEPMKACVGRLTMPML